MDGLSRQLDAFMQGLLERTDPAIAQVMQAQAQALADAGLLDRALRAGDIAPEFALPDQAGRVVSLRELLARGPVVLTFFRGGWCPFCTLALRGLAKKLPELRRQGAEVVAISPQASGGAQQTAERNGLSFPVLVDHDNQVGRRYGLVYELGPELRAVYERLGHALPQLNDSKEWALPVPAGFVIGQDGRVAYAHVDARVNRRLEPSEAVAAVRKLCTGNPAVG